MDSVNDFILEVEKKLLHFLRNIKNKIFDDKKVFIKKFSHYLIKIPLLNLDSKLKGKYLYICPVNSRIRSHVKGNNIYLYMLPYEDLSSVESARESLEKIPRYYTIKFRDEFKRCMSSFYGDFSVFSSISLVTRLDALIESRDLNSFALQVDRSFFVEKFPLKDIVDVLERVKTMLSLVKKENISGDLSVPFSYLKHKCDYTFLYFENRLNNMRKDLEIYPDWPDSDTLSKEVDIIEKILSLRDYFYNILFVFEKESLENQPESDIIDTGSDIQTDINEEFDMGLVGEELK